jgi:hypothetical protein
VHESQIGDCLLAATHLLPVKLQFDRAPNLIDRPNERLQRHTPTVHPPDAAIASMPGERIVKFLRQLRVTRHPLEGVPERVEAVSGIADDPPWQRWRDLGR